MPNKHICTDGADLARSIPSLRHIRLAGSQTGHAPRPCFRIHARLVERPQSGITHGLWDGSYARGVISRIVLT